VSAPVFKRVAEQVLAYMGVPHDVEPKNNASRRQLVAKASEHDAEEAQQNAAPVLPEFASTAVPVAPAAPAPTPQSTPGAAAPQPGPQHLPPPPVPQPPSHPGSVVLDVGAGSTVPSFMGLSMRAAVEAAHRAGYELQIVGSGVAREQQPAPGSHLPQGSRIAVRFAR
jgi:cell division protein FtsI (penicillin-binding protein 3)